MGRKEMPLGFWWKSQKEGAHYENLHVGGRIILKCRLLSSAT
jgi:hypothetical protein